MRPMFAEYPGVPGLDSFDEFMKMVSKILALSKTRMKRISVLCSLQLKKKFRQGYKFYTGLLVQFQKSSKNYKHVQTSLGKLRQLQIRQVYPVIIKYPYWWSCSSPICIVLVTRCFSDTVQSSIALNVLFYFFLDFIYF